MVLSSPCLPPAPGRRSARWRCIVLLGGLLLGLCGAALLGELDPGIAVRHE
ncbi:MAG: hypothetical protein ACJ75H_04900 [Thermoanaerobaculia bacterium]